MLFSQSNKIIPQKILPKGLAQIERRRMISVSQTSILNLWSFYQKVGNRAKKSHPLSVISMWTVTLEGRCDGGVTVRKPVLPIAPLLPCRGARLLSYWRRGMLKTTSIYSDSKALSELFLNPRSNLQGFLFCNCYIINDSQSAATK